MLKGSDINGINKIIIHSFDTQVEVQRKSEVKKVRFQGRMKSFGGVF
jgi:hypothetical protein